MGYNRTMSDEVRQKISNSMRGRKLPEATKEAISKGVKAAWDKVPRKTENGETITVSRENNADKNIYFNGKEYMPAR